MQVNSLESSSADKGTEESTISCPFWYLSYVDR